MGLYKDMLQIAAINFDPGQETSILCGRATIFFNREKKYYETRSKTNERKHSSS